MTEEIQKDRFYSGFAAVVGRPNVGKSTLINALVGQKVAIVSDRPQTTRNRIRGVMNTGNCQIVLIDTPGMQKPKNKLGQYMRGEAERAIDGVEAVIVVLDMQAGVGAGDHQILRWVEAGQAPAIAVLNKIDAITPERAAGQMALLDPYPRIARRLAVSALTGQGLDGLVAALEPLMPEGPKYFPDEMYTDQPERVITAEIIREKALRALSQEVPHGIGVEVMRIAPRKDKQMLEIAATIYCERPSHKGIVIGKSGSMLKRIGSESRKDIEDLFGEKVFLELWVKVREDWRNSPTALRELGYTKE